MVSLSFVLAASLGGQAELPRLTLPKGSTWKERVEMTTSFLPPDTFTETIVYEDTVTVLEGGNLQRARLPIDSSVAGQKIALPDKPTPLILTETFEGWPLLTPDPESPFTRRLWRATRYSATTQASLAAIPEERIPAAKYAASWSKGQVHTTFTEVGGLTAKGKWTFDKVGRIVSARIVCENAFAPGGDGTPATFTVDIRATGPRSP